ncbi:5'-methylthioadenosine/S-adenosylhomocysteine nucleosidase [Bacillaceae bacterium S4-13-56]
MSIGIIGAMEEEVKEILNFVEVKETKEVAGCLFHKGVLQGTEVVVLQSGIGKVNAAMATTILQERYHPKYVINTGSAGGFDPDLQVGDIIISNVVTHHDVDVTAFNYEYGQVPGMPIVFEAHSELQRIARQAIEQLPQSIQVKTGMIASGDTFMEDAQKVNTVREQFPKVLCVEMEAAAIAQVCHVYKTPFVIIRSLSDIAGKESSISFDSYLEKAAKNSAQLISFMVERINQK